MICGVDANVLIYSAIESIPEHRKVLSFFERRVLTGELTCGFSAGAPSMDAQTFLEGEWRPEPFWYELQQHRKRNR